MFTYVCSERLTAGVKCTAKATVMLIDIQRDNVKKPILVKVDKDEDHLSDKNVAKAISEETRHKLVKEKALL